MDAGRRFGSLGPGATGGCEPPRECRGAEWGPLKEQPAFLLLSLLSRPEGTSFILSNLELLP